MIKYTILTPFAEGEKSEKSEEPGKNRHKRSPAGRFSQSAEKGKSQLARRERPDAHYYQLPNVTPPPDGGH